MLATLCLSHEMMGRPVWRHKQEYIQFLTPTVRTFLQFKQSPWSSIIPPTVHQNSFMKICSTILEYRGSDKSDFNRNYTGS